MYRPSEEEEGAGETLWFGLEPTLNEEEELIRRSLVEILLQEAPVAPSFTSDLEFESILSARGLIRFKKDSF